MCMHKHKHRSTGREDTHKHTNAHNRKSVNEWEGAGRLAGAVLEEDMASVHLSISEHSQLSSLSTGGEVISFLFFSSAPSSTSLLISVPAFSPPFFIYLLRPPLLLYPSTFALFSSTLQLFLFHSTLLLSTASFLPSSSSAPVRSQWNSPFSNKTKLPAASRSG